MLVLQSIPLPVAMQVWVFALHLGRGGVAQSEFVAQSIPESPPKTHCLLLLSQYFISQAVSSLQIFPAPAVVHCLNIGLKGLVSHFAITGPPQLSQFDTPQVFEFIHCPLFLSHTLWGLVSPAGQPPQSSQFDTPQVSEFAHCWFTQAVWGLVSPAGQPPQFEQSEVPQKFTLAQTLFTHSLCGVVFGNRHPPQFEQSEISQPFEVSHFPSTHVE